MRQLILENTQNFATLPALFSLTGLPRKEREAFHQLLRQMEKEGLLCFQKGSYRKLDGKSGGVVEGEIVKVTDRFGFMKPDNGEDQDYFVPGRYLRGSLPGDRVLLRRMSSRGELPEGRVEKILDATKKPLIGVVHENVQGFTVKPDHISIDFKVAKGHLGNAKVGDKVLAFIFRRGESHFDHQVSVKMVFGNSESAAVCAAAILEENGVRTEFPKEVWEEAESANGKGIVAKELSGRVDLRDRPIFTIDGPDTKDIDDAISLERVGDGYRLGVHIADVSHYVREKTPLDQEAYLRGTSVYYADQVVPMLPKALSNGICSLNPGEDRLAFSVFMEVDGNGTLGKSKLEKTVIHSKVKGVYSEVNHILEKTASPAIQAKYAQVEDSLFLMEELAEKLAGQRKRRGSFDLESTESKLIIDSQSGKAVDIVPRERGTSEKMIEEFMLLCNEAVAQFSREKELPFLYRVHEKPGEQKVAELSESLQVLGIIDHGLGETITQDEIQTLLEKVQGTRYQEVFNYRILRTMQKARYAPEPIGHYGLALSDYTHFTSPIRRYPDLLIHRILSEYLEDHRSPKELALRFGSFVADAAEQSSGREVAALTVERDCEDCYKAEYMKGHLGETYEAKIVGFTPKGIFVELPNTVEGRVDLSTFPGKEYDLKSNVVLLEKGTEQSYSIGQPISVVVSRVEVASGQVDFVPKEYYQTFLEEQKNPALKKPALRSRPGDSGKSPRKLGAAADSKITYPKTGKSEGNSSSGKQKNRRRRPRRRNGGSAPLG